MSSKSNLATVDTSPYFERALRHAIEHGVVDAARLEAMKREGAKGVVQLAAFFSTAHLRPELEAARTRLVTLVSLCLEVESGRKLDTAAVMLREKTLLALSKAGADRLRQLLALPSDNILTDERWLREDEKSFLAYRTLDEPVTFARYLFERRTREKNRDHIELAYCLAERLGLSREAARDLSIPSESVINSALLVLYTSRNPSTLFNQAGFVALHAAARKKRTPSFPDIQDWVPPALHRLLDKAQEHFITRVLPIIKSASAQEILRDTESFAGLFHFDEGGIDDIASHDRALAEQWRKITGQQGSHPDVQCTVLLSVATGLAPVRSLRKQDAIAIWEGYRAAGFDDDAVAQFIDEVVPFEYQDDLTRLWEDDLSIEASAQLDDSDVDSVLAYLQDTCRTSWKKRVD